MYSSLSNYSHFIPSIESVREFFSETAGEVEGKVMQGMGLGNQIFLIMTTLAYAKRSGQKAWFEHRDNYVSRPAYWNNFLVTLQPLLRHTSSHASNPYREGNGDMWYYELSIHPPHDSLEGYFQTEHYFKNEFSELYDQLRIGSFRDQIKQRMNLTTSQPTVSLHFRLGDYKKLPGFHPIAPSSYYEKSLSYLQDELQQPFTVYYFYEKEDQEAEKLKH